VTGPKGDTGATGATGAKGDTGDQGPSGVIAVTAPITNSGTSTSATIGVDAGSTSTAGVLQLTDSTSSTSTTTAATPNAVKSAYDLANTMVAKTALRKSMLQDSSVDTFPRFSVSNNAVVSVTGSQRFIAISPIEDITISSITFVGGTAVSSGLTLARFGLYTSDGTNLTLVARTASDTTIFNTTLTAYTRSLATAGGYPSTYTMTAGTRYYVSVLQTGTTIGNLTSCVINAGLAGLSPTWAYSLGSQTDLATNPLISSLSVGAIIYARVS
jgi:hypothetical protein